MFQKNEEEATEEETDGRHFGHSAHFYNEQQEVQKNHWPGSESD